MGIFDIFKPKKEKTFKEQIIDKFYNDYPETPYIADDREKEWFKMAAMFSQSLVDRKNMIRYDDGLLPGHVYMLYWMNKYKGKNRKIPRYFEFDYGIDFEKEREFLIQQGLFDINTGLTEKGENAISRHTEVVESRHSKPKNIGDQEKGLLSFSDCGRTIPSKPDATYKIPVKDIPLIASEMSGINQAIKKACRLGRIRTDLTIDPKKIEFDCPETRYELHKNTKSGKKSKYPLTFHYSYYNHSEVFETPIDYFGELNYLKTGIIGDARLIFWKKKKGYFIKIRTKKDQTFIKSVETVDFSKGPNKVRKYYCN